MKFPRQFLPVMPLVLVVGSLPLAPAQAQFSQQAKLVGTGAIGGPFAEGAGQGESVSVSRDGDTAIVGGPFDNQPAVLPPGGEADAGAAWIFTRSRGVWRQQTKLVGTGAIGNAGQGISVAISGDGKTAIIGGPLDNNRAGAVWVYAQSVFAGSPGRSNCYGDSVGALARKYGGLNGAAAALDFSSVSALQDTVMDYCEG
jgi:hypothetical protein